MIHIADGIVVMLNTVENEMSIVRKMRIFIIVIITFKTNLCYNFFFLVETFFEPSMCAVCVLRHVLIGLKPYQSYGLVTRVYTGITILQYVL